MDGLRALAILSVVLYHAGVRKLSGGFTGVDVFFVISGYLIGGHIHAELDAGSFRFSNFYRNRAKRILPALYVVLIAVLAVGVVLLSPRELRNLAMYLFATIASASNIALWRTTGYFAASADQNPLLMTWSLGVEEQFYLVIPVLLLLLARVRQRLLLPFIVGVSVMSFVLACYQVNHTPTSAFYLLGSRAWELGIGVTLAIIEARSPRLSGGRTGLTSNLQSWVGLGLIVAPFFLLTAETPFPGMAALPSVIGSALLLSSSGGWVNRRLLTLAPVVFIGRISYSFYLAHWPLLSFLRIVRGSDLPEVWGLGAVAVAFGLAVVSYFWVEIPFRTSKRAAGDLLRRYGAASVVLLLVAGLIFHSKGMPWRYPRAALVDDTVAGSQRDACLVESGTSTPRLAAACTGSSSPGGHVALWGDSHASALAPGLRTLAAQQGYFLEEYAKTTCPPLLGVGRYYRQEPALADECIRFNSAVLERLIEDPQVQVVMLEAYWDAPFDPVADSGKLATADHKGTELPMEAESEELLTSSLRATLGALVAAHKRVVVFGDVPVFETDPIWRMRTSAIPIRRKLAEAMIGNASRIDSGVDRAFDQTPPQRAAQILLQDTASSFAGVEYWDLRKNLCGINGDCSYRRNDVTLYVDTNHFSPEGARLALQGWPLPLR